jgi:hypothetical protein
MELTKTEKQTLLQQAIEGEEQTVTKLETFLEGYPLDTDINKCVALEVMNVIVSKRAGIERLKVRGAELLL